MDKLILSTLASFFILGSSLHAQTPRAPLDAYLETGKTIVIGKCLAIGPANIIGRSRVDIQILYVVKGKETLRNIAIVSQIQMKVGETYLLRTENEAVSDKLYFEVKTGDSVVPVGSGEDIEKIKTLTPRIVVLRTMNLRVDELESEIRSMTYELDALKAARKEE